MTAIEYDILDELYFVTSYSSLKEASGHSDQVLKDSLIQLLKKGFIKVYQSIDIELDSNQTNLGNSYKSYYYLASKKGLFEHNAR